MVIPTRKNAVTSSSHVEAEAPEWFGFSPSSSLEPAINKEDNEAMLQKKAKTFNLANQATVNMLWVLLLTIRMKMHGVLRFLTEFQVQTKIAKAYLATQQKEMEEMEEIPEKQ